MNSMYWAERSSLIVGLTLLKDQSYYLSISTSNRFVTGLEFNSNDRIRGKACMINDLPMKQLSTQYRTTGARQLNQAKVCWQTLRVCALNPQLTFGGVWGDELNCNSSSTRAPYILQEELRKNISKLYSNQ